LQKIPWYSFTGAILRTTRYRYPMQNVLAGFNFGKRFKVIDAGNSLSSGPVSSFQQNIGIFACKDS